jgi:hypothetical protein
MPGFDEAQPRPANRRPPYFESLNQARTTVAEQRKHIDSLREAIARLGRSWEQIERDAPALPPATRALLNAQMDALHELALLALKEQTTQTRLIDALDRMRPKSVLRCGYRDYLSGTALILALAALFV